MSEIPDLSETLPEPTWLRRAVVVTFLWGEQQHTFPCFACSIVKAPSQYHDGQEFEWLHVKAYLGSPNDPKLFAGPFSTTLCLIPLSYVVRMTYWGRFNLSQQKKGDLAIFPIKHPAPSSAMEPKIIREIINNLQVNEGNAEPMLYDNFVRDITDRFEHALAKIKAEHNFEYGNEFETAICRTLRTMLPEKYGICRGYVVSKLGQKAGDDIIIYDKMGFPTLRGLGKDDFATKEQVPIEAVYAYIEAKHTLCIEGDGGTSFQKAVNQVAQVKMLCNSRGAIPFVTDDVRYLESGWPTIRNPAYGVILSRYVKQKDSGKRLEDPKEILGHLLGSAPPMSLLPPGYMHFW
jgi:hypothetical protein